MNKSKKNAKRIKGYNWEFNTVDSEQVNAWCMPGGKLFFILESCPYAQPN